MKSGASKAWNAVKTHGLPVLKNVGKNLLQKGMGMAQNIMGSAQQP